MATHFDSIEQAICGALQSLSGARGWTDAKWTTKVKSSLAKLGKDRGYGVYASSISMKLRKGGEFLYDVIWLKQDKGYLLRVPLVAESEWSVAKGAASDDFQKLLMARADHRLMVLSAKRGHPAAEIIDPLIKEIERCESRERGDRYLFASWLEPSKEFAFRLHVVNRGARGTVRRRGSKPR